MREFYKRNNGSEGIIKVVGIHESEDYLCTWSLFEEEMHPFRYHKYEFEREFDKIDTSEVDNLERQICFRRLESIQGHATVQLPDYWKKFPNGDRVCSYCGSIHPMDLIELIKKLGFGIIGKTDKPYKWYVNRPEVHNATDGAIKYYRQHDTEEFIDKYNEQVDIQVNNK